MYMYSLRVFELYYEEMYGAVTMSYNLHQVTNHLAESVNNCGPLTFMSSNDFEDYLQKCKKNVKAHNNVPQQFINQLQQRLM